MEVGTQHAPPGFLSDFILGSEDGIVNVLGIILGLSAATDNARLIIIATLAALAAESIAMGMVAYTSTRSRRRLYLAERARELREMRDTPEEERADVRAILSGWGYRGPELEELVLRIEANPKAMVEMMLAFELKLAPVEPTAPRRSGLLVGGATVFGHAIPLVPFFFVGSDVLLGASLAIVASAIALFGIGWYESKITIGNWWQNGLQMAMIGLAGGFAGYLIGHFLGASPGLGL
ncbi:MAG: VIT1/CCC1 transporter family protein [Thermoplasmata archaeon]|nr:VIT1/CCC1 transporter family protein [Thermoplasmata archaeon]